LKRTEVIQKYSTKHGLLFSHKENETLGICDKMDGTGDHYIKSNKPGMEGQVRLPKSTKDPTSKENCINIFDKQRHKNP
jgi:hypothetical protein